MYESGDLRKGIKIEIDGDPYVVVDFQFVKPGKGQALYKCRLRNMISGNQFDRTYRSGEKFKPANLDEQQMEYLYAEGDRYCFMNTTSYEQDYLTKEQIGDDIKLLKENRVDAIFLQSGEVKPRTILLGNLVPKHSTNSQLFNN